MKYKKKVGEHWIPINNSQNKFIGFNTNKHKKEK